METSIIKTFDFNNKQLATYLYKGEPWFRAKDVAEMLDYSNTKQAISINVYNEDIKSASAMGTTCNTLINCHPQTKFINESGLYALIFGSKKGEAKQFKHWITSEVLPTLRKTGQYNMKPKKISNNHVLYLTNEAELQKAVIKFLRQHEEKYNLKIVVPLGELQDTEDKRINSHQMGYSKGQPDIIINNVSIHHDGLIIELKTPNGNGQLSQEQINVIKKYREDGYKTIVSNDFADIVRKLTLHFRHLRLRCKHCGKKFKTVETRASHMKGMKHIN